MKEKTTIDLIRHGEPEGGRMYRGCGTDHPLSSKGWIQMQHSIASCDQDWQQIISSPMMRCRRFALKLSNSLNIPLHVIDDFKEAHYGVWEGKTPNQLISENETAYWQYHEDPVYSRPALSEPLMEFTNRVSSAFEQLLQTFAGSRTLLISHAGTMRAILTSCLSAPIESQQCLKVPYAGMYRIEKERKIIRIHLL